MSSSAPSSSQSQRTPLHERSNSEKNRLQIRLVPYTPPRAEPEDEEQTEAGPGSGPSSGHGSGPSRTGRDSQGSGTDPKSETSYNDFHRNYDQATGATWTRSRTPLVEDDYVFDTTFDQSCPATPVQSKRTRAVSGSKPATASSGRPEPTTPQNPAYNRPLAARSRGLSAPVQFSRAENAPPSPTRQRPRSRQSRVINVHSDGTFSVDVKAPQQSDRTASSLISSYTSTFTSRERTSFGTTSAIIPSSPPSSAPERSVSPYASSSVTYTEESKRPATASLWNYPMVGGLRKVPRTPDLKSQKGEERKDRKPREGSISSTSLPPLPEAAIAPPETSRHIPKPSFNSGHSTSTDSTDSSADENANCRVIGRSSPAGQDSDIPDSNSLPSLPSSEPNYRVIQESSPAPPLASSPAHEYLDTPGSRNLIVHATTPSTVATASRRPRPQYSNDSLSERVRDQYSQESLVIPPLNPRKRSSLERFGYYRQISRESSLRGRANSFSSISSIISQDTASLLVSATPNLVRLHRSPSASSIQPPTWAGQSGLPPHRTRMESNPNQWTSQLSTVMSEYEGSEYSRLATAPSRSGSSMLGSRHSRQLLSMSSSPLEEEALAAMQSSESLEPPSSAYMRGALLSPAVRHLDEHGDGLADLQQHQLQHKRSWSRTGGYLSRRGSDRELHSSASSRAGSLTSAALPTWARLYYGSGERRWLMRAPSMQSLSEVSPSRPGSSFASGSPAEDHAPSNIWNPRRRPREGLTEDDKQSVSVDEAGPVGGVQELRLGPKKKTSSIWSPHLRFDRRAIRYSMWEPPSVPWAPEGGMSGLVKVQVLLFVAGFGVPLAWMVASFLPLPPKPALEMFERDSSATGLGIAAQQAENLDQRVAPIDDTRYQSARWWRNLNRIMSVIGLLILGTIITLVVVGTQQGWGKS